MSITKKITKVNTRSKLTGNLEERRKEVENRIHDWYPNLEILVHYTYANTKMKFHCKRCDSIFERAPHMLMYNRNRTKYGCPKCNVQNRAQNKSKTLSDLLKELHQRFPNIQYISGYKNCHTKAHFKCLKCGKEFDRVWNIFKTAKDGCPYCIHKHWGGNRRKDPKEYQKEFDAKFPNLTLLTPYVTARQNVTVKCNKCGNIWQASPLSLLTHKYGCEKCAYKRLGINNRKSQKDFWNELKKINPDVYVKSKYVTNKQPIEVQCKICGYVWKARPNDLLTGRARCNRCGQAQSTYKRSNFCKMYRKVRSKKPNESYQLYNQHAYAYYIKKKHPDAQLLTLFQTQDNYVKVKCLKCGNTRHVYAQNLGDGVACLNCERGDRYVSKGERVIVSLLSQAGIHYEYPFIPGDLVDKISLHYDFRVRGKYLIEFQGEQHYRPVDYFGGEERFKIQKQHDQMKREWAKENGFTLIEIKYNDPIKEKLSQYFPQVLKYEPNINFKAVNHSKKITIKHARLNTQLIHEYNVLSNGLTVNKVMHKALNYIQKYDLKLVHAKYATASSRKNVLIRQVRFTDAEYKVFDQYSEQFDSASDELRSILHTYYLEHIKDNMRKYELVK